MTDRSLRQQFIEYIARQQLFTAGQKVLVAVSGGIDSMVLLHLLHSIKTNAAVAHCNFGLRGEESDGDEALVREKAKEYGFPVYVKRFSTEDHASEKSISIQMAARELRYEWFGKLSERHRYDYIAIAHNRDDRIETLFINLARGTGVHGLTGIRPKSGKIIRPLLFASREEIKAYTTENYVVFREDSSNSEDKYVRNYIRHHLVPGLEKYFPGVQQALDRSMDHFAETEAIYNHTIGHYKKQITETKDDLFFVNLPALLATPSPSAVLYEIIHPFGFSGANVSDILSRAGQCSGQQFFSSTHRLLLNRQTLVIKTSEESAQKEFMIGEDTNDVFFPVQLHFHCFDRYPGFKIQADPTIAFLDREKLQFPLLLRKWKPGDSFRPLGMNRSKKLSDFFIDHKLSVIEKENTWILTSAGKIVWVMGWRLDDRFKITEATKQIMKIHTTRSAT